MGEKLTLKRFWVIWVNKLTPLCFLLFFDGKSYTTMFFGSVLAKKLTLQLCFWWKRLTLHWFGFLLVKNRHYGGVGMFLVKKVSTTMVVGI